jgi:uncharacterized protein YecT (DUF1311 family)
MNIGDFRPSLLKDRSPNVNLNLPRLIFIIWVTALLSMRPAWAIDNPDQPNRSAEFLNRALPFEERIAEESSAADLATASRAYDRFLDAELNQAYQQLLTHVNGEARRALIAAQRQWLHFRDAENSFIDRNWTQDNFGSSSRLSRADYRSTLVKQRVLNLLAYLQNY